MLQTSQPAARFEKVPFEEFLKAVNTRHEELAEHELAAIKQTYDNIILPSRATPGSAGYDFFMPYNMCYDPEVIPFEPSMYHDKTILVPTGIRCYIRTGWMLAMFPRSSLGFKYSMRLVNTTGIIDSDYYNADNYGHIMIKFEADQPFNLNAGDAFVQGVLLPHGLADQDKPRKHQRIGGFGSTDKGA